MSELFISGGIVIDPEKKEKYAANVLLRGGVIAAIGDLTAPEGAAVIDAGGCYVCPGFIDPHGHIDGHLYTGELSLLQGITTTIGGNCGFSPVDLERFFNEQKAFPIHQGEMIGMCALRHAAGVYDPFQAASEEQVDRMAQLCERALLSGACGVSLGPAYTPGSSILEMQTLCAVARRHGKPVSIDTRMNSMTDLNSLQEAIDLAAHSGCRMIVSHFVYQYGVGVEDEAMAMVDRARGMGVDILFDSGMYKDWCSSIGAALFEPGIMRANGIELHHLRMITGEHIGVVPDEELYLHLREQHPDDAVVVNTGSQRAVYAIAKNPLCMVSTDTGAYEPGEGHPQIAGSFPRFLREMVIERAEMGWEEAIVHMTLWPAQVLGLEKKGRMQPGCDADLVILNPQTLHDRADFPGLGAPNAAPDGVNYVIVAGEIAAQYAKPTGVMAGRAIRI
ncbi:MAG: amidohydrolase family protein [Clostridia bacterium]|nr:amidohydrolase family protein [Clostridia bacterium]